MRVPEFISASLIILGGFQMPVLAKDVLNQNELAYLKRTEKATFTGFGKFFDPVTALPVDIASVAGGDAVILPKDTNFSKTSPTNIGLGFLYLVLARDRGYLREKNAYTRALAMMETLEKLETHQGFLFNWYYISGRNEIPKVTLNRFVSSLDNGDLDICLMAAAGAFPGTELSKRIEIFLTKKNYHFFFEKNPNRGGSGMINVGYDAAEKSYQGADYSIFNTEARMTAWVAVLKDNVPESVWKNQARLTRIYTTLDQEKIPVVAAWGGSLYETLFADEILGGHKIAPNAFEKNALHMVRIHQDKGKKISKSGIWGLSNGEVPGENRYEMTGVSEIAYNRFPGEFVTVYSSFLSLRHAPQAVIENLKQMEELNPGVFNLNYGFTDSIDPKTGVINKNILSLDKGMEVLAIGNFMNAMEGKKEISDYLWAYAKEKGRDKKMRALIQAEEKHPSFLLLSNSENADTPLKDPQPSVDLIDVRQDIGAFYEPNRAKAIVTLAENENKIPELEIQYDVSQRYSFSGAFIRSDDLDISNYRALVLQIKGGDSGHPETVKVELKYQGQYVQFEHVRVKAEWNETRILLPPSAEKFDELTFVIENACAQNSPKGKISVRALTLQ